MRRDKLVTLQWSQSSEIMGGYSTPDYVVTYTCYRGDDWLMFGYFSATAALLIPRHNDRCDVVRAVAGTPDTSLADGVYRCDKGEIEVTGATGYLSTRIAHSTGYGSRQCPWLIRAPRGQHIQLTLYDFTDVSESNRHRMVRRHVITGVIGNESQVIGLPSRS